ncbi:MAG: hypothetical protein V4487_09285 [Chlamydiota bacterium]
MKIGSLELFENNSSAQLGAQTNHGLPIGQGPGVPLAWTAAPTDGQILIGSTGMDPVLNTLTAGAGIAISNGPGMITITASIPGSTNWQLATFNQTVFGNVGYICTGGGNLMLLLSPLGALGDILEITLDGASSWTLLLGGQTVRYGNIAIAGTISSNAQGDSIRMVRQSAARWNLLSSIGNLTTV